jgi:hypothetical protein
MFANPPSQYDTLYAEAAKRIQMLEVENQSLLNIIATQNQELFALRRTTTAAASSRSQSLDRTDNKILANLPEPSTTNPIAALMNFCRHYLHTELEFQHEIDHRNHHIVTVWMHGRQLSWCQDARKRRAREIAAKLAIEYLNDHPQFVLQLRAQ